MSPRARSLGMVKTRYGEVAAVAVHKDDADRWLRLRLDPSAWDRLDPRDFGVDPGREVVFAEIRRSTWPDREG